MYTTPRVSLGAGFLASAFLLGGIGITVGPALVATPETITLTLPEEDLREAQLAPTPSQIQNVAEQSSCKVKIDEVEVCAIELEPDLSIPDPRLPIYTI